MGIARICSKRIAHKLGITLHSIAYWRVKRIHKKMSANIIVIATAFIPSVAMTFESHMKSGRN
ncbi:MAG: hypothetical protein COZ47_03785 [Lysobacterales bacterium CG_4_10_14_3_um_filter_64_11]|nr:MAG: hypothetical protein COZ47_03785 [Xanthomonadales bacterium CG_4_10_14_3_um_filter_64_11]